MRTAMLATCEAQLEELKAEAAAKESTSKEAIERVTSLQAALAACEARLAERVRDAAAGTYITVYIAVSFEFNRELIVELSNTVSILFLYFN